MKAVIVGDKRFASLGEATAETGHGRVKLIKLIESGKPLDDGRAIAWATDADVAPAKPSKTRQPRRVNAPPRLSPPAVPAGAPSIDTLEAALAELPAPKPSDALRRAEGENVPMHPLTAVANLLAQLAGQGVKLQRVTVVSIEGLEVGSGG